MQEPANWKRMKAGPNLNGFTLTSKEGNLIPHILLEKEHQNFHLCFVTNSNELGWQFGQNWKHKVMNSRFCKRPKYFLSFLLDERVYQNFFTAEGQIFKRRAGWVTLGHWPLWEHPSLSCSFRKLSHLGESGLPFDLNYWSADDFSTCSEHKTREIRTCLK